MQRILEAITSGDSAAAAGLAIPESYRGVVVRADEVDMFDGLPTRERDPRKSLHVEEVPTPEVGPGEALIAVMASAINYNTVWTAIFEPVPTFRFLQRYGRLSALTRRHDLPYHVVGSDAAGVVLRVGAGVAKWKQGDVVLIWGASGGLGSYATQMALGGGAVPVCVVSSPEKAEICRRMGVELVIDRVGEGFRFWKDQNHQDESEWRRFGARIRELTGGDDPDIVFEHPGRETFGASVFVAKRGGTVVTCASTSGYLHQYDNRYLWMNLKRIIGAHFANYAEAWASNRLIARGRIHPTLSKAYPLSQTGQAAWEVHRNAHQGKVGVLCLAPEEGLGVRDPDLRARHETAINRFRGQ